MSSPRAPFDQGLFLTHFNKGKAFYDERKYADAERELEEAYLLRPRDQKVLNLLGLVYFKQDKFEKAEEVYRKLVAESPEAHTLYYNLGLIDFKLGHLEEAEGAFLKALELAPENPKISFYLGSIYERQQRFQDAIYQYRQAGANIMVRRVEDKLAAGSPASPPRPPAPPAPPPRAAAPAATAADHPPRLDDTAEFKASEIREAIGGRSKTEPVIVPPKTLHPVSEVLLAEDANKRPGPDTVRFRVKAPPPSAAPTPTVFRGLENNLVEVEVAGKVFIKQGTIYSYSGDLTFWVKDRRPGGHSALVIVTGRGRLILSDHHREITFQHVEDEQIWVEPAHLLACEESFTPRYAALPGGPQDLEFVVLEGRGRIAFSVASRPLSLSVTPEMPVSAPAASVISWSGGLTPRVVQDPALYEVMAAGAAEGGPLVRLEGTGRVLVEQIG